MAAVVDVGRVWEILSRIRRVRTGDIIMPEDHNLLKEALEELTVAVTPVGPSPPLSVVSRQPMYHKVRLNNVSNDPTNAYTESITFYGQVSFHPVVRWAIVWDFYQPAVPPRFSYKCWWRFDRADTIFCSVSYTINLVKDGVPLPEHIDIFDNSPGNQNTYWVYASATADCPPCDPNYCIHGCTNYEWEKPWDLWADIHAAAGTSVEGEVVITDTIPGPCYGIVTDANPDLYEFVVDGEVREFYAWRTGGGDIVAYLPVDFKLYGGEELEIRVKEGKGGPPSRDYWIRRLDYLIT
jgi:hypothetical protein